MLAACFTLYEAPFWDGILTKRLDLHGAQLRNVITCSSVGNLFILVPAMLADTHPPMFVALFGAALVAAGYTVFYLGWVTLDSVEWKVYAVIAAYAWGVAWIYGAAFVTAISNAETRSKGKAIGTMLAFLYFANGWFTEVTEFEGNGHTTLKKSALRHEFIAVTALLCAPGLFKLRARERKCSGGDACLSGTSVALFLMLVLMFGQWLVTGGSGSTNLFNFWYGDVPFAYTLGYALTLLFCAAVGGYNLRRHGFASLHGWGRGNEQSRVMLRPADAAVGGSVGSDEASSGKSESSLKRHQRVKAVLKQQQQQQQQQQGGGGAYGSGGWGGGGSGGAAAPLSEVLMRVFHDKRYVLLFAIFAIDIGTGQTMANRFTQIKDMYGKHWTMVAAEYNLTRPFGALCIGAVVDHVPSRSKLLLVVTSLMAVGQFLFALSAADASLKMTSFSWFPLPMEKIPLFLCGFSTGAMFTLVPIIEMESFGEEAIGRIHGTTMVGAILGQTLIYNVVSVALSFSATLWITLVACVFAVALAAKLHFEYAEDLCWRPPPGLIEEDGEREGREGGKGGVGASRNKRGGRSESDDDQWSCMGLKFRGGAGEEGATKDERIRAALEERQALLTSVPV